MEEKARSNKHVSPGSQFYPKKKINIVQENSTHAKMLSDILLLLIVSFFR